MLNSILFRFLIKGTYKQGDQQTIRIKTKDIDKRTR